MQREQFILFFIVLIRSEEDKDAYLKEEITHFWQLFLE